MSVKRYRVNTLPGRITRDCPEVVLATDFDAIASRLEEAERIFQRASSWFEIQEVALRNEQGAKARSIADSMRTFLKARP